MSWHLFSAKPLSKPVVTYFLLDIEDKIITCGSEYKAFSSQTWQVITWTSKYQDLQLHVS